MNRVEQMLDFEGNELRMLDLLSRGTGIRAIAAELGYQPGTVRVYLHRLYRKLGVANQIEAVGWYIAAQQTEPLAVGPQPATKTNVLGDLANESSLFVALGAMSAFVGPYSLQWEVATRLRGDVLDTRRHEKRTYSRRLWCALMQGDFAFAKQAFDQDRGESVTGDEPYNMAMFFALLAGGGYAAASSVLGRLADRRRARAAPREVQLARNFKSALEGDARALAGLDQAAAIRGSNIGRMHLALVLAFHARRLKGDLAGASIAAARLWREAENVRKELEAMGERPFDPPAAAPPVTRPRKKAVSVR